MQPGLRVLRHLCAWYEVEKKPTHSVLHLKQGGSVLLRRCGKLDFLVIREATTREINVITSSTMNLEVESLKSEMRALRTGHLVNVRGEAALDT